MEQNFWIRGWLVEPGRLRISRRGREVTVKPRSMAVLVELARAEGEVVPRNVLIDTVWKGAAISDDALTQTIAELRRAFSDDAQRPRYVETIKRVGIRLIPRATREGPASRTLRARLLWGIAAAVVVATGGAFLVWRSAPPAAAPVSSIAVLPFANLSGDESDDYFADGLTEEVITVLAGVPGLQVSARTSSFAYRDRGMDVREIGARLHVANVLEGSVRRSGNRIRVTAQLIEVGSGFHRWSRSYDHELDDAFAIQQEIAGEVLTALAPQFGIVPSAPTTNGRAYDLFLAGKQHLHAGRYELAADLFADAVEADSGFALAYANLAIAITAFHENATGVRQIGTGSATPIDVATSALRTAELAGLRHADVFIAEAAVAAFEGDLDAEALALERAIELNPMSVDARMRYSANLAARGRYIEALEELEAVADADPLNVELAVRHATLLALLSGYESGRARLQRLVDLDLASPMLWGTMAELAAEYGRYAERVEYARNAVRLAPADAWAMAQLGDAYTELGEFTLADRWIATAERFSSTAALKARCRWFAATGDWAGFGRYIHAAADSIGTAETSESLTPAQSAASGLLALERGHAGDHSQAVRLLRHMQDSSPTLRRRSPYLPVYVDVLLAREYRAMDDGPGLADSLADAQALLDELRQTGIRRHPWLTLLQASVYALGGNDARAEQAFAESIEQGWSAWILEQHGVARPLERFGTEARLLDEKLAERRRGVADSGLLSGPEDL